MENKARQVPETIEPLNWMLGMKQFKRYICLKQVATFIEYILCNLNIVVTSPIAYVGLFILLLNSICRVQIKYVFM